LAIIFVYFATFNSLITDRSVGGTSGKLYAGKFQDGFWDNWDYFVKKLQIFCGIGYEIKMFD
jgi:hypothetical protein